MWFIIPIVICILLYLFLIAPRLVGKPDVAPLCGVHYAHRGLFNNDSGAPENSLDAMRKAVDAGYGIEFDVQLSKDHVPVVFHDTTLKRMCGVEGNVWEYTLEELQRMRLVNSNQSIPTLKQVLQVVQGQVPLIIEYKMSLEGTEVCKIANEILRNYKGAYCIESFQPHVVQWYRKYCPDVIRGQLSQDFSKTEKQDMKHWLLTNLLLNFLTRPDFIAYKHKDANNLSRCICKFMGALSVAWTIRNEEQYQEAKDKFDLFIFDSFMLK